MSSLSCYVMLCTAGGLTQISVSESVKLVVKVVFCFCILFFEHLLWILLINTAKCNIG